MSVRLRIDRIVVHGGRGPGFERTLKTELARALAARGVSDPKRLGAEIARSVAAAAAPRGAGSSPRGASAPQPSNVNSHQFVRPAIAMDPPRQEPPTK
jgi:hypothetical protein